MELGEHEPNEPPVADCDCRRCAVATRDALRKDAERYRWLQASKAGTIRLDGDHTVPNDLRWAAPQYVNWGNGLTLNAAVDAAMAADQSIGAA